MSSTTTSTTLPPQQQQSLQFPKGLLDGLFRQLPLWARNHIILAWADVFDPENDYNDQGIIELIGTMTKLDFNHYLKIVDDEAKFLSLANLPFTSNLTHLDLSYSAIGHSDVLIEFLSHPIFHHLVNLNLCSTEITSLDPLLNSPHTFTTLHALDISYNQHLPISLSQISHKFPNLKVLNLLYTKGVDDTHAEQQEQQPPPATFQLKKLSISIEALEAQEPHFQQYLSQLTHFRLKSSDWNTNFITQLFDPQKCVMRNLTVLDLSQACSSTANLSAIAQCPFLSNLIALRLPWSLDPHVDHLIQSPFLWSSKLKHLQLHFSSDNPATELITALETASAKLETFSDLSPAKWPLDIFATSPVFSQLKHFNLKNGSFIRGDHLLPQSWDVLWQQFIQSPNLSNLVTFTLPKLFKNIDHHHWTEKDVISLFTSPMMSNDLVELNLISCYSAITDDVIETIFTTRVIPGDKTSPLKFGQLEWLYCFQTQIGARGIAAIVQNLPQLAHLGLGHCENFDDEAMVALIGDEHTDPLQPYPALPNLTYLSLLNPSMTDQGCIELSKSQLLDQLEYLEMFSWFQSRQTQIGDTAILATPLYSNMKQFRSPKNSLYNTSLETTYQHLSNATHQIGNYINFNKIDPFWNAE